MSAKRVLMVGYYGKGNFGDDVLMSITHRLLRRTLPHATLSMVVDGEVGGYVSRLLTDVTMLPSGRHGHFDFIVHGGGGVFFDFAAHGWWARVGVSLLEWLGFRHFLALEHQLRQWLGKARTSTPCRLGLGIGVGGFSAGSGVMLQKLPILADFKALWVRDVASQQQLMRFQSVMAGEVMVGSDLAFLTDTWVPEPLPQKPVSTRPRLGVILRDWPQFSESPDLAETLAQLANDYDITGFIFDSQSDPKTRALFAPYPTHCWQPERMSIADFSSLLRGQDVLLTSRAHGAICGACVGVPSVLVAIEPKLEQIHAMLPQSSILVPADVPQQWADAVRAACAISSTAIAEDVARNRAASEAALKQIARWLV